ncbi:MAG: amidohydrolase family protein [Planctomycetota bacterium]
MLKIASCLLLLASGLFGQGRLLEEVTSQLSQEDPWVTDPGKAPSTLLEYTATEGTWISVDVSPGGQHLVFDLLGHLYEMPIEGGDAKPLTSGRSWNLFPRYSPDGTEIAFTSDRGGSNDLWILHREEGTLQNVSQMEWPVFQGDWSADGRLLYGTALNMQVRFPAFQFNRLGGKREIIPAGDRAPLNHFVADPKRHRLIFEHRDERLYASGARLKTYDLETGETYLLVDRPGGAFNPSLSPDGRLLAYVHRDDLETVLVVRDLETRQDRIVRRGLDRDRQESGTFYGCYPNMDWHPDGRLFLTFGGGIHALDVEAGETTKIPFRAPVKRQVDRTIRFPLEVPVSGKTKARSYQWAIDTSAGVIFTALGDIYIAGELGVEPLTRTDAHETCPVFDEKEGWLYYATWNDDTLGAIARRKLQSDEEEILTDRPSQYGSLALSNTGQSRFPRRSEGGPVTGGRSLAFLRGAGGLMDGQRLEDQTELELCLRTWDGTITKVTDVHWSSNRYAKRPPTVMFGPEDQWLYFTEYEGDALTLKRIHLDGDGEQVVYTLPHATRAVPSPDLKWLAFREYHRTFVTPWEFTGQPLEVSAADGVGTTRRSKMGDFFGWSADSQFLHSTIGPSFVREPVDQLVRPKEPQVFEAFEHRDLSVDYEVEVPSWRVLLQNARIITMDGERRVLESSQVLIDGNRIEAVGDDVKLEHGLRIMDLSGCTIIPGIFDAHGHYGSPISALNVVEQRLYGLHANLAYGVTTMYDVYGTTQKDFLVSDLLRAGRIDGPRIFSVGDPIFVTKYRTKMHRPIQSYEDALEVVGFNASQGAQCVKDYSNHRRAARRQLALACRELGINIVTESFADPQMNLTQIVDGFTGIEHTLGLTPLYEDVLRLFAHSDIGVDPTLIVVYNGVSGEDWFRQREKVWENEKLLHFFRADELRRYRRPTHHFDDDFYHPEMASELRKLKAVGVPLMVGAHGQMQGLGAHWEMEMFVHGGFTPAEALEIATINGYRHHGLDHVLGSIEAGKLADFVVLEDNPLGDIRNTRKIRWVMKNGVLYSGEDGSRLWPEKRPAKKMYFQRD